MELTSHTFSEGIKSIIGIHSACVSIFKKAPYILISKMNITGPCFNIFNATQTVEKIPQTEHLELNRNVKQASMT